jgi:TIR domain-containing protein
VKSVAKKRSAVGYRVFLSHAYKDRWIAKQCARLIEEAAKPHVEVFFDEKDIEGGQSIPDSVRSGIEKCDEFLVLLSRYSKDRPWVLVEMGAAWGLRKPIIAIIDKIGPKEMPDIVSPYKAIDLNDFDQYINQLLKRTKVGR